MDGEQTMQYAHMPERRDSNISNLDSAVSTPFQSHQSLGQALGAHSHLSHAPHPGAGSSHGAPLTFAVAGQTSPGLKRKPINELAANSQLPKRRRDGDEVDAYDPDGGGQGAKHWTDEEKSRLFNYLMGPGQDDHWNSLRATKNSCLRECAIDIFGGKKTYQALKGCYERNFNLFKQIYAFESYHQASGQAHSGSLSNLGEADRLREIDRRLQTVRKAGVEVGNINPRTIDQWHRHGWYDLFYRRWHGDPATTRPVAAPARPSGGPSGQPVHTIDEPDNDDDHGLDFADPASLSNHSTTMNGLTNDRNAHSVAFINPQSLRDTSLRDTAPMPHSPVTPLIAHTTTMSPPHVGTSAVVSVAPPPSTSATSTSSTLNTAPPIPNIPAPSATSSDQMVNVTLTQGMISTYLQFLQVQTQTCKMKLEYMRRREEREERDGSARREIERLRQEREMAEFEHNKQTAKTKQKADRAIEVLGNPNVDPTLRQAASDYLKKLFVND
ncbi:hypothetical protein HGRIS_003571 [Hohenbuehelia grisea]|uniref:Myb-like domain-containing protein n=1 Tax=Hohenbuehelia grisea TaxID=104357 RepID=A0ABR3JHF1_9AGAR